MGLGRKTGEEANENPLPIAAFRSETLKEDVLEARKSGEDASLLFQQNACSEYRSAVPPKSPPSGKDFVAQLAKGQ